MFYVIMSNACENLYCAKFIFNSNVHLCVGTNLRLTVIFCALFWDSISKCDLGFDRPWHNVSEWQTFFWPYVKMYSVSLVDFFHELVCKCRVKNLAEKYFSVFFKVWYSPDMLKLLKWTSQRRTISGAFYQPLGINTPENNPNTGVLKSEN